MRKYMSKSQRACDSCRARKSACRIDSYPPCRLCHLSGRDCTFDKTSRTTRSVPGPALQVSPSSVNQTTSETANPILAELRPDTVFDNDVQFEQQDGDGLQVNDIYDLGIGDLANFGPTYELNNPQGGLWLDQAMMDLGLQAFDHMDASPNDVTAAQAGVRPSIPPQEVETTSMVCGLTGDMDPYLMQRYNFDSDNNFVFKRLTVRSMLQDVHPVQLLVNNTTGDVDETVNVTARGHLEELVSPDIGIRLISL
jgi:hypothetical protein